ncbi:hypothetical protein [Aminobacterium colombiense]
MSIITPYLKHTAQLKAKTSYDEFGQPITGEPINFKCRFTYKNEVIVDKAGKSIISSVTILTEEKINVDDVVLYDGKCFFVVSIETIVDVGGREVGRQVFCNGPS